MGPPLVENAEACSNQIAGIGRRWSSHCGRKIQTSSSWHQRVPESTTSGAVLTPGPPVLCFNCFWARLRWAFSYTEWELFSVIFFFFFFKCIYLTASGLTYGKWDLLLWCEGLVVVAGWTWLPWSMWDLSSWIRTWTFVPCFARQILNQGSPFVIFWV